MGGAGEGAEGPVWHGLAAGAIAGLCSRFVVYPADTLKAQLQVHGALGRAAAGSGVGVPRTTYGTFMQIARTEGLPGFYRGFSSVLLGSVPGNVCYFGGYEVGKRVVAQADQVLAASLAPNLASLFFDLALVNLQRLGHRDAKDSAGKPVSVLSGIRGGMAVGLVAQLVAGLAFTPMDIIKERMQVQGLMGGAYRYRNGMHALTTLVKREGVAGLFKGYWATNSVWIPWNILYIASYEELKRSAADRLGCDTPDDLPAPAFPACAATAAAMAAVVTNPMDVVKTRLQVLTGDAGKLNSLDIARTLWQKEGLRGFGAGMTARIINIAPGCAISWFVYENLKQWMGTKFP